MTTPTTLTPTAAAFVDAARAFVEHLDGLALAGINAYRRGEQAIASALLDAIEAEMLQAREMIGDGHRMDRDAEIRFSDAEMGLTYLLPALSALAALIDDVDSDVEAFVTEMLAKGRS